MSIDTTSTPEKAADPTRVVTDLELLHRFIGQKLEQGRRHDPLEDCLAEFHRYLAAVNRLRDEIRPGLERSLRGEYGRELDVEELKARVTQRLAEQGITD